MRLHIARVRVRDSMWTSTNVDEFQKKKEIKWMEINNNKYLTKYVWQG